MLRWKLGSVHGIGIYVHGTFFFLPAFVFLSTWSAGLATALQAVALVFAVFGCVVLHELGHAWMARYYGIGTRDITLYPIGGVARLERMSEQPWQEFFIALAGPAVNVIIALALVPALAVASLSAGGESVLPEAGMAPHGVTGFLLNLAAANVFLVLFNLLPAFPMDGGRVLRALLALGLGRLRATEVAAKVGLVIALLMMVAGPTISATTPVNMWMLGVVGAFVLFAGQQELAAVRRREARRQARPLWALPADDAVVDVQPAGPAPGFSGLAWDVSRRAWVMWHNGRPVMVFGARPE